MELVQDNIQTDTDKYLSIMLESYENQLRQVEDGLTKLADHVAQMEAQRDAFAQDIVTIRGLLGLDEETEETRQAAEQVSQSQETEE